MYSSPIHMSSRWLNITYLGLAQKPTPTILHWGPRGPQTHQFWKTMQAWVWLLTYWSLLLGNCSHVTRERSSDQFFLADHTATVWFAIIIVMSVCPSVWRSVTLCIVVVKVGVQDYKLYQHVPSRQSPINCSFRPFLLQKAPEKRVKENANLSFLRHRQPCVHWFIAHYLLLWIWEDRRRELCLSRLSGLRLGAFINSTRKSLIVYQLFVDLNLYPKPVW